MKELLTVLAIVLIATTAVFAYVSFSGSATVGYKFTFDGSTKAIYGDDADTADLTLAVTTDYFQSRFENRYGLWIEFF